MPDALDEPMSRREQDDWDRKHPPLPGHRQHQCTDLGWAIVLGVASFVLVCMWVTELVSGNVTKLDRGFNDRGQMCGVDVPGKPYVFWCSDESGKGMDWNHPICTAECPKDSTTDHECFDHNLNATVYVPDYPTVLIMSTCVPSERSLEAFALDQIEAAKVLLFFTEVRRAWFVLLVNTLLTIAVGYAFLAVLDRDAKSSLQACIVTCITLPTLLGVWFLVRSRGSVHDAEVTEDEFYANLRWGFGTLGVAALLGCFSSCACRDLHKSLHCIEATCECIFGQPTIMLTPLIAFGSMLTLGLFMLIGFLYLLSAGDMRLGQAHGVSEKTVTYSEEQWWAMVFWIFMTIWLLETIHAMSQYVLAWSAQLWYYTPTDAESETKLDLPTCCIFRAYNNAIKYHIGTLAFGGFVIGLLRIPRLLFDFLTYAAASPAGETIMKVCGCLIRLNNKFLQPYSKAAYMDVAITTSNFCTAAGRAQEVLWEEGGAVAALNGGQLIVFIAGGGLLTMIGFAFTWLSEGHRRAVAAAAAALESAERRRGGRRAEKPAALSSPTLEDARKRPPPPRAPAAVPPGGRGPARGFTRFCL
ncbi:unnamed protein product [Prorocentrum cordatum]|uniref:Choline transporter-like protein n=2 Tax=Prorocentrum cordatum TaxID=2364126 RepID=A0ABN9TN02_9DINO|nr:unnamed protein product [Polarella glacialis]